LCNDTADSEYSPVWSHGGLVVIADVSLRPRGADDKSGPEALDELMTWWEAAVARRLSVGFPRCAWKSLLEPTSAG